MTLTKDPFSIRIIGYVLAIGGLIGELAAFILTIEKIEIIEDPSYTPSCSINPVLSCGSVMTTDQASVFGFPNPLIGIAAFAIVTTVGIATIVGVKFPRWWWWAFQAGTLCGIGFVHWLFLQSLYEINALCPYCMVVWVVTITVFWYTTLFTLHQGHILLPARTRPVVEFTVRNHTVVLLLWFGFLIVLIGEQFWSYWKTLL